ncbi:MAG TPA: HEAT repeat domain-containing protein, partial [Thermoanaerobaculia bacterium]|nr:HEAT repeat domain-containing protein [Thermoanaerobaculia bacterium]
MASLEPVDSPPTWDECMALLDRLPSLPLETRVHAIERLVRNSSPGIRERALRIGSAVLSDEQLTEYLRNDEDAVLRNAGLEIFKMRGGRSFPFAIRLLKDPDEDVVLQAVLILDHLRDPRALEPLRGVLDHPDTNVIQAALLAMGKIGDARCIPDLLPFLSGDAWLQMAAVQALGDLRSPLAIRPLSGLLTDLLVGSLAAEAMARIGGAAAFRALAAHWLAYREQLESEAMLGLLAHVLEGLSQPPTRVEGLEEALAEALADPAVEARSAAARCLLVLGPTAWDEAALDTLAESQPSGAAGFPPALARRQDLIGLLLTRAGDLRAWGFYLGARHPRAVPAEEFFAALPEATGALEFLEPIARALGKLRHARLGSALLDLYLRLPAESRGVLSRVLKSHAREVSEALAARAEVDPVDRLVLSALLGQPAREVVQGILELPPSQRPSAVSQLDDLKPVVRLLPWEEWLAAAPGLYGEIAAEAACHAELRELLPALRERAAAAPTPPYIRAFGTLRDRDSVPLLLDLLERQRPLRPLVLEALGRIGGPEARAVLRESTRSGDRGEARIAFRALSV